MPYQPNTAAIGFTNWMLNISRQHLSGPQRVIVEQVLAAAIGGFPVSDQIWYNFNLFSAWRNPYYLVFLDYASVSVPSLLSGIVAAYNFEGNSNDSVSGLNGTDTDITYGLPYGKIDQGALFSLMSSEIDLPSISLSNTFTLSLWVNISVIAGSYAAILGRASSRPGLIILPGSNIIDWDVSSDFTFTNPITIGAWNLITLRSNAGFLECFLNNVKDPTSYSGVPGTSIQRLGNFAGSEWFLGNMDMLNIWNRPLSDLEINQLWNGGAGIQYPF